MNILRRPRSTGTSIVSSILRSSAAIDVHHDLLRGAREVPRRIAGHDEVQPRAEREQPVGVLQREIRAARRQRSRTPDHQRMVVRHHVVRRPGRQDRHAEPLDQRRASRRARRRGGRRCQSGSTGRSAELSRSMVRRTAAAIASGGCQPGDRRPRPGSNPRSDCLVDHRALHVERQVDPHRARAVRCARGARPSRGDSGCLPAPSPSPRTW